VLGLQLLEGRLLEARDDLPPSAEGVVVVDRAWARRFFPGRSAVGRRFRGGGCTDCPWTRVVGVTSEVKYAGLDRPDEGSVYTLLPGRTAPPEVEPARNRFVLLRTSVDPASLQGVVRRAVREIDPSVPLANAAVMDDVIARSLERPRTLSRLVVGFAAVALVLSLVGIYGVMAYYVQQHAKEISIRVALGARPGEVLRLIVGQAMKVVASGVALGLLAALVVARLMASLLFGVGANDPGALLTVATLLPAAALLACLVPVRRALAVQPAVLLRAE
jgi:putative ABC transport system permease protein